MEYGCLRWTCPDGTVPPLPERVTGFALGRALQRVRSPLGLRVDGRAPRPLRRLDPHPAEFFVLGDAEDALGDEWNLFTGRFEAAARRAGLTFDTAARLHLALCEMGENAVVHAAAPAILVGYTAAAGYALFCVSDVGVGVLASLRRNPRHAHLARHNDAIRAALHDGVSACPDGGGFGFRQVFGSLADQWGSLRFRSGEGCITMAGTACEADRGSVAYPPPLPGFQVAVCCRTAPAGEQLQADQPLI
jgi:hypothetical protein